MKIAYLTAGAAGMYCGSCLHDNALAKQLIRLGNDCLLIPVYTPIRTDDENVSIDRVFMGGLNVFLQQKLPWLAYSPQWIDNFLNQGWLIQKLTKNVGKTSPKLLGSLAVSMLDGIHGRQRKEFARLLGWLTSDIAPDVIVFTNLLIGGGIPELKRRSTAKIVVTLQGDDIFLDSLPAKYREMAIDRLKRLVPMVDAFIVHSHDYAARMSELLAIPSRQIHVVPLGIPTKDFITSSPSCIGPASDTFTIGYFARMAQEKGLERIVDAFLALATKPGFGHLHLKLAGWMGPQHEDLWSRLKGKLEEAGLSKRWEYCGSIERSDKATFLNSLDLFCVPTVYAEPKGLFLLEAVACGVPYLQPSHGAFPEIHERLKKNADGLPIGELFDAHSPDDLVLKLKAIALQARGRYQISPKLLTEIGIEQHAARVLEILSS